MILEMREGRRDEIRVDVQLASSICGCFSFISSIRHKRRKFGRKRDWASALKYR